MIGVDRYVSSGRHSAPWFRVSWAKIVSIGRGLGARFFDIAKGFRGIFFGAVIFSLVVALLSSYYAPGFSGNNMLAGIELWLDSDPGAWYLQSGHQIGRVPAVFFGHPGIPLKLGNHFVQKIIYHIYHGAGESYTDCIVRELYLVQVWSRGLVALIWILVAWVIKAATEKLFNDSGAGYISAILFLTSFSVVYYINRISPEPYMMLFFLGAFYCLLLVRQNSNAGNWGRSLFWACAATSSSVAAFYTKLHLFGPFPVFVILYLGVFFYGSVRRLFFYKVLFISFLVSLLTAACFERFMDWPSFLRGWHETYSSIAFSGISLTAILPITDKIRIVFSTEYGLIFLYCLSFLFADIRKNTDLIALNVYILFPTLVFVARASAWGAHGFHYFMPFLAVGCIHAAYVIRQITFSSANVLQVNAAMRALVVVVAINISGLALGVAAHLTRIKQGREARQTYLELAALKPGDIMSEKLRENLINIGIINLGEYNYGPPSLMEVRLH